MHEGGKLFRRLGFAAVFMLRCVGARRRWAKEIQLAVSPPRSATAGRSIP